LNKYPPRPTEVRNCSNVRRVFSRRDWFYQNVRLMQALTDKGYDVNYTWGINTHGQRMGAPILPEMMRWLWRDHPVSTDVDDAVERSFNEPKKK
jgi:enterochelin esterase family protein